MAKLGEAFVRVRADMATFSKDLDKEIPKITQKFEKSLNKQFGQKLGDDTGSGFAQGFSSSTSGVAKTLANNLKTAGGQVRNSGRQSGNNFTQGFGQGLSQVGPIRKGLSNIITALEDGFSSLPAEIKAIVGGAILAAIIPVGGLLTAALSTAIVLGVAGLGIALASQLEEVQTRWGDFVMFLRESFVSNASVFIAPISDALDLFENSIEHLDAVIERVFGRAADFVVPLAEGVSKLVEGIFEGLDRGFEALDFDSLSAELISSFEYLGDTIGQVLEMFLSNPNIGEGFSDLLITLSDLLYITGEFLNWTLDAYIALKDLYNVVSEIIEPFIELALVIGELTKFQGDVNSAWAEFIDLDYERIGIQKIGVNQSKDYNNAQAGTIALTKEQEKAVKELNKQLKEQLDLVNDVITSEIDYEEAVDRTNEVLKEYHGNLDTSDKRGRKTVEAIQNQINSLKEYTATQVESGQMTEEQAQRYYNNEIARLEAEFKKRGGSIKQFQEIFGWLIKLQGAPVVPDKFGPFRISLRDSLTLLQAVTAAANTLAKAPKAKAPNYYQGGQQAYADGGFITAPTMALMGEGYKPELVLPLSQPQRSAQLLAQSPLAGALGGAPIVNVYVGNEQLDARMYRVASDANQAQGRVLSMQPRSI